MTSSDLYQIQDNLGLSSSETVGVIVAVVCGVTTFIILILIISLACRHFFHRHSNRERLDISDITPREMGCSSSVRERYCLQELHEEEEESSETLSSPSPSSVDDSTTSHKRNVRKAASRLAEVVDAHRPLLQPRQFPRDNLTLGVMLGEGEYGPIYRGEAHGLGLNNESIPVVVKVLSINEEVISHTLFKQDVEMLSSINHLNVVELLAVCTHESPQYILLDAGQPGDLLTHIREKKNSLPHCSAITMEFLRIADEICIGMGYLVSERFIHKDLALRNCSIGFDAVVKISHLGIGPLAYPEAYFRVNETDLPIRWMSPEAITNASFTSMSDVWSFGVTLWELFTYGELPFSDRSNEEVLEYLLGEEGRLHKPIVCSDHIFDLILSCWTNDPHSRPFFLDIHESLTELSQILSSLSVLDLGTPDSSSST